MYEIPQSPTLKCCHDGLTICMIFWSMRAVYTVKILPNLADNPIYADLKIILTYP